MFLDYLSRGFWLSLLIFIAFQWLAIPIISALTTSARGVMLGIVIIIGVIYPIYFSLTIFYLRKVKKFNAEQLIVAGFILLLPLLAYVPIIS